MSQNGSDNTNIPWQSWVIASILVVAIPVVPQILDKLNSSNTGSPTTFSTSNPTRSKPDVLSNNTSSTTTNSAGTTAEEFYSRGLEKVGKGDLQGAVSDYTEALKLKSDFPAAYYDRGVAYQSLGNYELALADYNSAIHLKQNYIATYYGRGRVRLLMGDIQGSNADYQELLRLVPETAFDYDNQSYARVALGDTQSGIRGLQKAAELYLKDNQPKRYQKILEEIKRLQTKLVGRQAG